MRITIKERVTYLIVMLFTLATIYLGFSQSIRSRIYHHIYQIGPYQLQPWLPLGLHAIFALSILACLTILLAVNIFASKPNCANQLVTSLQKLLYFLFLPVFLLITPINIYEYNYLHPINLVLLIYFWGIIAVFYYTCLMNYRANPSSTKFNCLLGLFILMSSVAAVRIVIYLCFEILKLKVAVEVSFLFAAIYMNFYLALVFLVLGDFWKNKFILNISIVGGILDLVIFIVMKVEHLI